MPTSTLPRTSVVDAIVERIGTDILSGEYGEGTLLPPERELARRYGINRTTLKHGLVRLAEAGLIETRHGVGSRVRPIAEAGTELLPALVTRSLPGRSWAGVVAEVVQARTAVGALIASEAARHATRADVDRLGALVDAVASASGATEVHALENDVHRALAQSAHNIVWRLFVNSLIRAYAPVRGMVDEAFVDAGAVAVGLRAVVDAVASGDPEVAGRCAAAYLDESAARIAAALRMEWPAA